MKEFRLLIFICVCISLGLEMLDLSDSEDDFLDEIDEEIDYDLEEGEFLPPEDWTSVSEPEKDEDVVPNVNIDEHVVSPTKTEFVFRNEDGESVIDLDSFINESTDSDTEYTDEIDERFKHLVGNPLYIQEMLKKKKDKKPRVMKEVDITGKRVLRSGIIGWYYDADLKLFAIKRFDGVQYFERKLVVFSSLPKYEVQDLARLDLINPSNDDYAKRVERIIRTEVRTKKFDKIKPRNGKTIKLKERSARTGRRRRQKVYPAVKCIQQIPMKIMPQNILENLKYWGVDSATGEAYMVEADDEAPFGEKEILRIYDRRHLMNLSKGDLVMLYKNKIRSTIGWGDAAREYQGMVKTCIKLKIFAGSKIYK